MRKGAPGESLEEALDGVTWISPNPFNEATAYLLLHPLTDGPLIPDGVQALSTELGLRRLDRDAEMMWVGTDTLVAALHGTRVGLWRGTRPWWSHAVTDAWTAAAIARRYIVLVVGTTPLCGEDSRAVSAYLGRHDQTYAGLVKIRFRLEDQ